MRFLHMHPDVQIETHEGVLVILWDRYVPGEVLAAEYKTAVTFCFQYVSDPMGHFSTELKELAELNFEDVQETNHPDRADLVNLVFTCSFRGAIRSHMAILRATKRKLMKVAGHAADCAAQAFNQEDTAAGAPALLLGIKPGSFDEH